jgi:hypothetical protein
MVMDKMVSSNLKLPRIGCDEHEWWLMSKILYFFVTTRMYFASRVTKNLNDTRLKSKQLVKMSKLIGPSKKKKAKKCLAKKPPTLGSAVVPNASNNIKSK